MTAYFDPYLIARPGFEATLRAEVLSVSTSPTWLWYLLSSSALASLTFLFSNLYVFDYLYYLINL